MTNVGHYMWVYTNDHKLHIIQTAKMKTVACVILENSILEVIELLHVPEWHMVLVLWELSEVWCLHDEVSESGLFQIDSFKSNKQSPINSLCKVTLGNTTEVWATRKDKEIVILTKSPSGCHEGNTLVCSTDKRAAYNCHLITCLHFVDDNEKFTHVWVSFSGCSQLVCWDGQSKIQLHKVSIHCEGQICKIIHSYIRSHVAISTKEPSSHISYCFLTIHLVNSSKLFI